MVVGGGYELAAGATVHVDMTNCPGPGDGSVGDPFCSIQAGIDAASSGVDEVLVAAGTYHETIDFNGKAILVGSTDPTNPAVVAATVLDGGHSGSVVTCSSNETALSVLNGMTITNGSAGSGGGMFNNFSNPTVMNCVFAGNSASFGGGMHNNQSDPMVVNCSFIDNAGSSGGGMDNLSFSDPILLNCIFAGNTCTTDGGGINNCFSSPTAVNCTFSGNTAFDDGGAMLNFNGNPASINCICWGNSDAVGTDDDDLRLSAGSVCIDAGDNGVVTEATDLDGAVRIRNCGVDLGAYESTPAAATVIIDTDCDHDVDGVDFAKFAQCFNKAGNPPRTLGCAAWVAIQLDSDDDGDIDGVDFAKFAQCFNKAGNPPRTLGCPEN
jgi:hypothetical protein